MIPSFASRDMGNTCWTHGVVPEPISIRVLMPQDGCVKSVKNEESDRQLSFKLMALLAQAVFTCTNSNAFKHEQFQIISL